MPKQQPKYRQGSTLVDIPFRLESEGQWWDRFYRLQLRGVSVATMVCRGIEAIESEPDGDT